ncbi:MAG: hypothetical protein M3357_19565 [Actinomycetota bacterium]|nr:hypothetical protein [Actinomycetota bacterium]
MFGEYGNFFVLVPYMFIVAAGVVFILIALRDRKPPSTTNLTARRKHPLRHLQVELNRARKSARDAARAEQGEVKAEPSEEKTKAQPPRRRRPPDGPGGLRRLK